MYGLARKRFFVEGIVMFGGMINLCKFLGGICIAFLFLGACSQTAKYANLSLPDTSANRQTGNIDSETVDLFNNFQHSSNADTPFTNIETKYPNYIEYPVDTLCANRASRMRWDDVVKILSSKSELNSSEKFLLAYSYQKKSRYRDAIPLFESLARDTGFVLNIDSRMELARSYSKIDSVEKAISVLSVRFPEDFAQKRLVLKYEIFSSAKKYRQALSILDTLDRKYPKRVSESRKKFMRARLYRSLGIKDSAVVLYESIFATDTGKNAFDAASALDDLNELKGENLFKAGKVALDQKKHAVAEDWFKRYIDSGARVSRGEAEYLHARAISRRGRFSEARNLYADMLKRKAYNPAWLQLGMAYCERKLEKFDLAKKTIKEALAVGIRTSAEPEIIWEQLQLALDTRDFAGASEYACSLATKFPSHEYADRSASWAGLSAFFDGNFLLASERYRYLVRNFKDQNFIDMGRFWHGVTLLFAGDSSGIDTLRKVTKSPTRHYYRYLADEIVSGESLPNPLFSKSGEWISMREAIELAHSSLSELGYRRAFIPVSSENAKRAELYARMGIIDRASEYFNKWVAEFPNEPPIKLAFVEIAVDYGLSKVAYMQSLGLVRSLGGYAKAPRNIIRLAYPTIYGDNVKMSAESEGIDHALLFAIIRRESEFDPYAVSSAGAIGLCQFMPTTGSNVARRLGEKNFSDNSLYDFEISIRFSANYLAELLRSHELAEHAIGEYNAGPAPIARWKKTYDKNFRPAFVEAVDFKETRHYIKSVLGDYYAYKELWDGSVNKK